MGSVDEEWANFISNKYASSDDDDDDEDIDDGCEMNDPEFYSEDRLETGSYFGDECAESYAKTSNNKSKFTNAYISDVPPTPSEIYISTKSKMVCLNTELDLTHLFWELKVLPYSIPKEGIIKKEMKFKFKTQDQLDDLKKKLDSTPDYYQEHILSHIIQPVAGETNSFQLVKDERKISIGMCKKDITSYKRKKKRAMANCLVLIIRLMDPATKFWYESHVKMFKTGQIEIPGIKNTDNFETLLTHILNVLQPHFTKTLEYTGLPRTVLINSNFNCNYYINREALHQLLKSKYNIQTIYDPCSYPGIQCKFYYNGDLGIQTGSQISKENNNKYKNITRVTFMVFRTGSVLIVGKCDEVILTHIYEFLKNLVMVEYKNICQKMKPPDTSSINKKVKKNRRKKNIDIEVSI
jgi:hypothetical protein